MLISMQSTAHDAFTQAAAFCLFAFMIAINAIWTVIKLTLWRHGHKGWFNVGDLRELKLLAARQPDAGTRAAYNRLHFAWYACFISLIIVPLTLLAIGALVSVVN